MLHERLNAICQVRLPHYFHLHWMCTNKHYSCDYRVVPALSLCLPEHQSDIQYPRNCIEKRQIKLLGHEDHIGSESFEHPKRTFAVPWNMSLSYEISEAQQFRELEVLAATGKNINKSDLRYKFETNDGWHSRIFKRYMAPLKHQRKFAHTVKDDKKPRHGYKQ